MNTLTAVLRFAFHENVITKCIFEIAVFYRGTILLKRQLWTNQNLCIKMEVPFQKAIVVIT